MPSEWTSQTEPAARSSEPSERPTVRLRPCRSPPPPAAVDPTPVAEPDARPTWPILPGYDILDELGRGGMGVVYKARQTALGRVVAVKLLTTGSHEDPERLERFHAEAEAVAQLQHPGIIRLYEVGVAAAGPYLVMEFAPGGSLAGRLAGAPQPAATAAGLVEQIARAVQAAHDKGILHRDLKPGNVLLAEPPDTPLERCTPRVSDFGLARRLNVDRGLTITGQVMGTPGYMSPEQVSGPSADLGPAADVYALGVVLYETLTGRPPYQGSTPLETVHLMLSEEPVSPAQLRPGLPRDLETICLKCLQREPRRRYASAGALADDLGRFRVGQPVHARPTTAWQRLGKWVRRQPGTASLAGCLVLFIAVAYALVTWLWLRADHAHRRSDRDRARAVSIARAEADARREAQRLSTRLLLERGVRLCEDGRIGPGLLWMQRGLREAPPDDARLIRSARALIGGWSGGLHQLRWYGRLPGEVSAVAVSGDGKLAAAARRGHVHVYHAGSGRPAGPPLPLPGRVLCLGPLGEGLAAVVHTGDQLQVYRLPGGERVGAAVPAAARPRAAAVSPDGRWLLVGGSDAAARLYHLETAAVLHTWAHGGPVRAVAFSPEGDWAVTGGDDRIARLWQVPSGRLVRTLEGHTGPVIAAAVGPDGQRVLTGGEDFRACLWDRDDGLKFRLAHEHAVCAVAFHPGRWLIATASYDDTAAVWDAETGKPIGASVRHAADVMAVAFGPDGGLLTAGEDATVRSWRLRDPAACAATLPHGASVLALAVSPDGRRVLTACSEGRLRLWSADSSRCRLVESARRPRAVAFAPDGRTFAVGGFGGDLRLFDTETARPIGAAMAHRAAVLCVAFSPDGERLAAGCEDAETTVHVWDVRARRIVYRLSGHARKVCAAAFSPDGRLLLTGSWDRTARLWDATDGRPFGSPLRHHDLVQSVAFGPDGRTVLTCGDDYTARLWDVSGEAVGLPLQHPDKVQAVAIAPGGWLVATGGKGHLARLWDAGTSQPLAPPLPHHRDVRSLAFGPGGRTLWTGSWDGTVRAWDMPAPLRGSAAEVLTWLAVHTGQRLDDKGVLINLDVAAWEASARRAVR